MPDRQARASLEKRRAHAVCCQRAGDRRGGTINASTAEKKGTPGAVLLRITLGMILIVTWFDNLGKDLYTADGLTAFLDFLFDQESGNGSSLTAYKLFLDAAVIPIARVYGAFQLVVELAIAIGLLFGIFTRLSSLIASFFFFNLFLSYFGGNEWIWTYVLLLSAAIAVFIGYGGRKLGVDAVLARSRGESPRTLLW